MSFAVATTFGIVIQSRIQPRTWSSGSSGATTNRSVPLAAMSTGSKVEAAVWAASSGLGHEGELVGDHREVRAALLLHRHTCGCAPRTLPRSSSRFLSFAVAARFPLKLVHRRGRIQAFQLVAGRLDTRPAAPRFPERRLLTCHRAAFPLLGAPRPAAGGSSTAARPSSVGRFKNPVRKGPVSGPQTKFSSSPGVANAYQVLRFAPLERLPAATILQLWRGRFADSRGYGRMMNRHRDR